MLGMRKVTRDLAVPVERLLPLSNELEVNWLKWLGFSVLNGVFQRRHVKTDRFIRKLLEDRLYF